MAVNCWVSPAAMDEFDGVTAIDTSMDWVTVGAVEPDTEPALAVTVVVPVCGKYPSFAGTAKPWLLASLLIEAMAGAEELQVTDASVCVMLSLKMPVATNCRNEDWASDATAWGT